MTQPRDLDYARTLASTDAERFWSRVDRNGPTPTHRPELGPCWVWTGAVARNGYGTFYWERKHRKAHRLAFLFEHGRWPTPRGLHHCDNRPCCRPSHIFEGTDYDNAMDRMAKGRHVPSRGDANGSRLYPERLTRGDDHWTRRCPERRLRGERHGRSVLSDDDVRWVRWAHAYAGCKLLDLAKAFGASKSGIASIVTGRTRSGTP